MLPLSHDVCCQGYSDDRGYPHGSTIHGMNFELLRYALWMVYCHMCSTRNVRQSYLMHLNELLCGCE